MARHLSKKHLFWLAPLLLLLFALAAGLSLVRASGWHWQGLGWQNGPTVAKVWRDNGSCPALEAHGIHLTGLWPVRVGINSLHLPACASGHPDSAPPALPFAPPFDVDIRSLRYGDYPPLHLQAHHRGQRWQATAHYNGSHLRASYNAGDGQWQLSGQLEAHDLYSRLDGTFQVQGNGIWQPEKTRPNRRFKGKLRIHGQHLGLIRKGTHGNLLLTASWTGGHWAADVTTDKPLALGHGWALHPGRILHARGQGTAIRQAHARLSAEGPEGMATVNLHSDGSHLHQGRGQIVLSSGLEGRVSMGWENGTLTIQPFTLTGPNGLVLASHKTISTPLRPTADLAPDLTLHYDGLTARTMQSHLQWQAGGIRWQGGIDLGGHFHGFRVNGHWSGQIDSDGAQGGPLTMTLADDNLHVQATLPTADLHGPDWPAEARLKGKFRGHAFTATLSGNRANGRLGGQLQAHARIPGMTSGGRLTLHGQWRWHDGLQLLPGAKVSVSRALKGHFLIRPLALTATTPLTLDADGVHGQLKLAADGLVATRWALPPVVGDMTFQGWDFDAALSIPKWGSTLSVTGHNLDATPHGQFRAETPLEPDISRSLDITTRAGRLSLKGRWRTKPTLALKGQLQGQDVALGWGSITASNLDAKLDFNWQAGSPPQILSHDPVTVGKVDIGFPITDISLNLDSDLQTWDFWDIKANLLGGHLKAFELLWPSTQFQPVELTGIDVGQLASLQSKPVVTLSGQISGRIPVKLQRHSLAIRNGTLHNETPLSLQLIATNSLRSLEKSHKAVNIALQALNPLRITDLSARVNMAADGWLKAAVTIKGKNPDRGNLPVIFNYTHKENVLDLLRSLRIGKRITSAVKKETSAASAPQ